MVARGHFRPYCAVQAPECGQAPGAENHGSASWTNNVSSNRSRWMPQRKGSCHFRSRVIQVDWYALQYSIPIFLCPLAYLTILMSGTHCHALNIAGIIQDPAAAVVFTLLCQQPEAVRWMRGRSGHPGRDGKERSSGDQQPS